MKMKLHTTIVRIIKEHAAKEYRKYSERYDTIKNFRYWPNSCFVDWLRFPITGSLDMELPTTDPSNIPIVKGRIRVSDLMNFDFNRDAVKKIDEITARLRPTYRASFYAMNEADACEQHYTLDDKYSSMKSFAHDIRVNYTEVRRLKIVKLD